VTAEVNEGWGGKTREKDRQMLTEETLEICISAGEGQNARFRIDCRAPLQ